MKSLFDETTLHGMRLKNRFVRSATCMRMADMKGHLTDKLRGVYETLAKGGIGMIITGYAFVLQEEQPSPYMLGIYDDTFIPEYRAFTDRLHDLGSRVVLQIVYGGTNTSFRPEGRVIWGPSAVTNKQSGVTARAMTEGDIRTVVRAFGAAAARAQAAGFDGVQIHGAHGYLISQFLNPYYNRRTDGYGGSWEGRGRILFEVYDEIRRCVGEAYPVLLKINADDFEEDGLAFEDTRAICKELDRRGIDAVELSGNLGRAQALLGTTWHGYALHPEAYFKEHAARLAEALTAPVMVVGGLREWDVVESLLQETKIAYFSLSKPLLYEPDLIARWQRGDRARAKCIDCGNCYHEDGNMCVFNPVD